MEDEIIDIKCVMVGDGCAGKTYAGTKYTRGLVLKDYIPTVFANDLKDVVVTKENRDSLHPSLKIGQIIRLSLWDTAGQVS